MLNVAIISVGSWKGIYFMCYYHYHGLIFINIYT